MKRTALNYSLAVLLMVPPAGCGGASADDSGTITVTIGYQSKTINTVTAGTLLRSLGYFERELAARGKREGVTYKVKWQDYATGAPITAQMTAGKIDIGSMGDFPLLINAARGTQLNRPTKLVSVTGYNLRGGLNTIVTAPDSKLSSLADLRGKKVSTSVGSAADGTLVRALRRAGIDPEEDISKLNQQPAVGASALQAGSADALSQFVAWPGLLAYQGRAKALYDGAELKLPTFHGVTAREDFAKKRPGVLEDFLRAQNKATGYLNKRPVAAAESVAEATGLPAEVVYLYNGAHGIATFDTSIKPALVAALKKDVPVLKSAKLVGDVDVDGFVDERYVKKAYGDGYASALSATPEPPRSQLWLKGESRTRSFATPAKMLRQAAARKGEVRTAYVPDTTTGTPWFADKAVWVADGKKLLPFVTPSTAAAYTEAHPGSRTLSYKKALEQVS
ncbi:putative nitrate ABC transporter, periplasmic protein [Streptomyces longisporoflavus]|uniref:ABC transporter substrate-binding protein n=1 Tax=Streptomyces longisporoflavus TaxID=28044 RepID=UPI00167E3D54|nr:ABC transporter substrate-binding protein [Streptomyces longisporoflavus]GGV67740.1 putative nitrate ABC transporter, periplasmic protein [Streptomyces longisporoflavus]